MKCSFKILANFIFLLPFLVGFSRIEADCPDVAASISKTSRKDELRKNIADHLKDFGNSTLVIPLPNQISGVSEQIRSASEMTNKLFSDFKAFEKFLSDIIDEMDAKIQHSEDRSEEAALLEVLKARAKKHGWNEIKLVPSFLRDEAFRTTIVGSGDLYGESNNFHPQHTRHVHLLQFLFLAEHMDGIHGVGFTRAFIQKLAEEENYFLWIFLFDERPPAFMKGEYQGQLRNPATFDFLYLNSVLPLDKVLNLLK
ncbi:MAG: hypothetical protein J0L93_10375 [Deltaproteobacteria bacterium]|nr:hypothetical protein [Deltaproteobacteria bacterium]